MNEVKALKHENGLLKDEVRDAKDASEKAPSAVMAALVDKLRADQVLIPPKITNIGLHIFVITKAPTYSEAKRNHFRTKMTTLGSRIFDLVFFWGGAATPCAFPPPRPSIFSDYSFWPTSLLTRMTSISLLMQWLLTSQWMFDLVCDMYYIGLN
jgi:hypothetical protein